MEIDVQAFNKLVDLAMVFALPLIAFLIGVRIAEREGFYENYSARSQYTFGVITSGLIVAILYAAASVQPDSIVVSKGDVKSCEELGAVLRDQINFQIILTDGVVSGPCMVKIIPEAVVGYLSPAHKYIITLILLIFLGTLSMDLVTVTRDTAKKFFKKRIEKHLPSGGGE